MIRVYVAGPMGPPGDGRRVNAIKAIDVGHELITHGYAPYLPQLNHWWDQLHPREAEEWMRQDFVWVRTCHALLRLPGYSVGADREIGEARANHIPVFFSIEGLNAWRDLGRIACCSTYQRQA